MIFLPSIQYNFDWSIEATPYTLSMCSLTEPFSTDEEIEIQKEILKVTDKEIEDNLFSILANIGAKDVGIGECLTGVIPNALIPESKKKELKLLLRLMNFPPLGELAIFLDQYNYTMSDQIKNFPLHFPN